MFSQDWADLLIGLGLGLAIGICIGAIGILTWAYIFYS